LGHKKHFPLIFDEFTQFTFDFFPATHLIQIDGTDGVKYIIMTPGIPVSTNISDDKTSDLWGFLERNFHSHFTSHGMPQKDGICDLVFPDKTDNVGGHVRDGMRVGVGGLSMVSQVYLIYRKFIGPGSGQRSP